MMQDITLNFGVSGEARKKLVKAVSAYKSVPSEYLGVPSFAFRVDEMIIDRDGILVIEGGMEEEELCGFLEYLREKGFQADHAIPHPGDTEEAVTEDEAETESAVDEYTVEVAVAEDPTEEPVIKAAVDTVVKEAADAPEDDETAVDTGDAGTIETVTETAVVEHVAAVTVEEEPIEEAVIETAAEEAVIKEAADVPDDETVTDPEDAGTEEAVVEHTVKDTVAKDPTEEPVIAAATEEAVDEHTVEEIVAYDPEKETAFENDDKIVIETTVEKPMIMADVPANDDTDKIVPEDMAEEAVVEHTVEEATADDPEDTGIDEDESVLTIQIPREGFTDQNLATLQLIIKSKEHLLKKSLDTDDLSILITDDRISFPWFQENDPANTSAYIHLISAICDMAKRAKRVTVTNQDIESEKYAFRTWLIRLGFGGPEYKEERAVLLKNLSGTSAFRNREAAEAFNERMKAKRAADKKRA